MSKTLIIDLLDPRFGVVESGLPAKIEGLAFGPDLADGRHLLIVTSDNDFIATEATSFMAFAIAPRRCRRTTLSTSSGLPSGPECRACGYVPRPAGGETASPPEAAKPPVRWRSRFAVAGSIFPNRQAARLRQILPVGHLAFVRDFPHAIEHLRLPLARAVFRTHALASSGIFP